MNLPTKTPTEMRTEEEEMKRKTSQEVILKKLAAIESLQNSVIKRHVHSDKSTSLNSPPKSHSPRKKMDSTFDERASLPPIVPKPAIVPVCSRRNSRVLLQPSTDSIHSQVSAMV